MGDEDLISTRCLFFDSGDGCGKAVRQIATPIPYLPTTTQIASVCLYSVGVVGARKLFCCLLTSYDCFAPRALKDVIKTFCPFFP